MGLVWSIYRRGQPAHGLLFVSGAAVLLATVAQNRFGYYLAPLLAVLTGAVCATALNWGDRNRWFGFPLALVLAGTVFYPTLRAGVQATAVDEGLSRDWFLTLESLRRSTPEPFASPDAYYARYDRPPFEFASMVPAYTVMSWWDFGHWILRVGHRVPVANSIQSGAVEAAAFFLATDPAKASEVLDATGSRYVIVDRTLVFELGNREGTLLGKFESMLRWTNNDRADYYEPFMETTPDGRLAPVFLFYPDYYRTMAYRLSFHGAQAATPDNSTWVITYATRTWPDGRPYKEVLRSRRLPTHADAESYLAELGPGPHLLVGRDPTATSVPLEALDRLVPRHNEPAATISLPVIRTFEHVPASETSAATP